MRRRTCALLSCMLGLCFAATMPRHKKVSTCLLGGKEDVGLSYFLPQNSLICLLIWRIQLLKGKKLQVNLQLVEETLEKAVVAFEDNVFRHTCSITSVFSKLCRSIYLVFAISKVNASLNLIIVEETSRVTTK